MVRGYTDNKQRESSLVFVKLYRQVLDMSRSGLVLNQEGDCSIKIIPEVVIRCSRSDQRLSCAAIPRVLFQQLHKELEAILQLQEEVQIVALRDEPINSLQIIMKEMVWSTIQDKGAIERQVKN